jgi:hypothetical protein
MMGPPIFVLGNPRSGTTLLRLVLTCHRNIVIPPECGFAVWLHPTFGRWPEGPGAGDAFLAEFANAVSQSRKFDTWKLATGDLLNALLARRPADYADAVSCVYEEFARSRGRTFTRWGDKNNFYLEHIATLRAMFPRARFVHIVRDGRDVACSYRELAARKPDSRYAPRLPDSVAEIARSWKANVERIEGDFARLGIGDAICIRYEDLVSEMEPSLKKLCEELGEPFDPTMLRYYALNRADGLEPAELLAWKEKTLNPPDLASTGRYRKDLTPDEIAAFAEIAGGTLARYGYI